MHLIPISNNMKYILSIMVEVFMDGSKKYKISIIIVTYNSSKYINKCVNSILTQEYPLSYYPLEIIVVDNCSIDATRNMLLEFNDIKIILNDSNTGYGRGNNLGVKHSTGQFLVIMNPDTIVEPHWLEELIEPIINNKKMITTPKILVYDSSIINTCGNIIHFTGLGFTRGYGAKPDTFSIPEYVCEMSGCCFAIKKEDYIGLGGFDESIFMYHDDVDLACRALLNGFKILFVPSSIIRHDFKLNVLPQKIYYLEKGRYMILRKYFSRRYLMLMAPSLLVVELLTFGYSMRYGSEGITYKLKAMKDGFAAKVDKVERGCLLIDYLMVTIPPEQLTYCRFDHFLKIAANKIFEWNYRMIR
jgi:GT2 family glycosyltransferase